MHAAHVVAAVRERLPDAEIVGMAGGNCARSGMDVRFEYRDYAVIGFTGILASLPRYYRLERRLKSLIASADVFVAVDYPGLNLRLCAAARALGKPVLYYIAPQVWAWGAGRVERMKRTVDRVAVVLPFEADIYRRAGVPVEFVGHPFVTDHELPDPLPDSERDWVALLPGSRPSEVDTILPVLLEVAELLAARRPGLGFAIGKSPVVDAELYARHLRATPLRVELRDDAVEVMARARAALVASGTATLQAALLETPLAIVYRTGAMNFALAKRLVKIPHVGLVNVLLGGEVAPEFVQGNARPERIAASVERVLDDAGCRRAMVERFRALRDHLGRGGGSARVAEMVGELVP
jgi:lipid-A-disaccharide synthase